MAQIIGAAGGSGRIFAALLSGHDHVAAEAARLLLRFFAPQAARSGAGPWAAAAAGAAAGEAAAAAAAAVSSEPGSEPREEERAAAHAAKEICFISHSRHVVLRALLRAMHAVHAMLRCVPCLDMAMDCSAVQPLPLLRSAAPAAACCLSSAGARRWCGCCARPAAPPC